MPTEISGSTGVNKIQDGTVQSSDLASGVGGKMLQAVQDTQTNSNTISSVNTWEDTSLSQNITLSSTSSKVLILVNGSQYQDQNDQTAGITVFRDSTNLGASDWGLSACYGYDTSLQDHQYPSSISYLDSPSTTSQITYSVKMRSDSQNYKFNGSRATVASLILIEIGA